MKKHLSPSPIIRSFFSFIFVIFSCILVQGQTTWTVTKTGDGNPTLAASTGELRWAIYNAAPGDIIDFKLPTGSVINLNTDNGTNTWWMQAIGIQENLTINGTNQTDGKPVTIVGNNHSIFSIGWYSGTPAGSLPPITSLNINNLVLVGSTTDVNGNPSPAISMGDVLPTSNVTFDSLYIGVHPNGTVEANSGHGILAIGTGNLKNISITNSTISGNLQNGIQLQGVTGTNLISNNKIGTNPTGTACVVTGAPNEVNNQGGNGYDGINLTGTSGTTISDNVVSCNGDGDVATSVLGKRGIYLEDSKNNTIIGNEIGTDITGNTALPNYKSGILISKGSTNNLIGGATTADRNIISGNGLNTGGYASIPDKHGIVIDWGGTTPSTNNKISGNYIGLAANGTCLGNSKNGVEIIGYGSGNTVGGSTPSEGNYIGCNGGDGVSLALGASNNYVRNNYIGTDKNGDSLGNGNNGVIMSSDAGTSTPIIPATPLIGNIVDSNVIGFNTANGIQTIGTERIDSISIKGNYVGIDPNGKKIANAKDGVLIQTDLRNIVIGGTTAGSSNYISYNGGNGINITPSASTGTSNLIQGNYIGTGLDGKTFAGNGVNGISINNNSKGILIGGTSASAANSIGDNGSDGIYITGANTDQITIQHNTIGGDLTTPKALGNGDYGIQADSPGGTVTIGGSSGNGNTIFGNSSGGILIKGSATAPTTTVSYNTIGNTTIASTGNGITVSGGNNTINNNSLFNYGSSGIRISGGQSAVDQNTIHDNTNDGIYISGANNTIGTNTGNDIYSNGDNGINIVGGSQNTISQNNIGVLGQNGFNGISLNGASNNTISNSNTIVNETATPAQMGIYVSNGSNSNTISGNYIGTNSAGSNTIGNGNGIIIDNSKNNNLTGNTIAGNINDGVQIEQTSTGNTLTSNYIGITSTGTPIANGTGVEIGYGASSNTIGGTTGNGNTISGNTGSGILIKSSNTNNILGNFIGTNSTGTAAIANGNSGIVISGTTTGTKIGDGTAGGSNVISGNTNYGISITGGSGNTINTNNIGTDNTGNPTIGNSKDGIFLSGSTTNNISNNTIGGNSTNGINITASSNNTTLTGNKIFKNTQNGVTIDASSSTTLTNNTIGSSTAGNGNTVGIRIQNGSTQSTITSNTIANNSNNGIQIDGGSSLKNLISQNSMFCNTGKGIALSAGGNNQYLSPLGKPDIQDQGGGTYALTGNYPTAIAGSTVEIFQKDGCEACGTYFKEGKTYLGSATISGGKFTYALAGFVLADTNNYLITITDPNGNTSEFSDCSTMPCTKPKSLINPANPAPVCYGNTVTLTANGYKGYYFTWYKLPNLTTGLNGTDVLNDSTFTATTSGQYRVKISNLHCDSTSPAVTVVILDPFHATIDTTSPTTCSPGNEGKITISGLTNDSTYTVQFDSLGTTVTRSTGKISGGQFVISGLTAGSYTNITLSKSGCDTTLANQTLNPYTETLDPGITGGNSVCNGQTVKLTATGTGTNPAGATYNWYKSSDMTNPVATSGTSYNADTSGNYVLIVANNGCSDTSAPQTVYIAPPWNVTIDTISPTTCSPGDEGKITISGLIKDSSYTVQYDSSGTTVSKNTGVIPVSGQFVIPGLTAGSYTNIILSKSGCDTTLANQTLLPYTETLDPGITGGDSICNGQTATLKATGNNPAGATYNWYNSSDLTSPVATAVTSYNATTSGKYLLVVADKGCSDTSAPQTVYIAPPLNFTVATSNPTTCGGNGTITLSGLHPTTSYIITYKDTTATEGPATKTTDASGNIVFPLPQSTYSNFIVDSASCTDTLPGPYTLNDPTPPALSASKTNPVTCGGDGSITISGLTAGQTYSYSYDTSGTTVGPLAWTPTSTKDSIAPIKEGTYSNIVVTWENCPVTIPDQTLKDPTPPVLSASKTNPTTCGGDGSITISGLTAGQTYSYSYDTSGTSIGPDSWTPTSTKDSITLLKQDTYSNIVVTWENCPITIPDQTLKDPTPPALSASKTDPTTCGGDGSITISGLTAGQTYSYSYDTSGTTVGPLSWTPTSTKDSIAPIKEGTYSNIIVTWENCPVTIPDQTLKDPGAPFISVSKMDPTKCSGTNGSITISGLTAGTSYDISYDLNGSLVSLTNQKANVAGQIPITGLGADTLTNIKAVITGTVCESNPEKATLTDPSKPVISTTPSNPTTCGGTDGSIVISGVQTSTSYSISYDSNGTTTTITQTSSGAGTLTINNLSKGTYSNIMVTNTQTNCPSNIEGPYTLKEPANPSINVTTSAITTCGGNGEIIIGGLQASISYQYFYDDPNTGTQSNTQTTNNSGQIILNVPAGKYTNIYVTLLNCPSLKKQTSLSNPVEVPAVSITPTTVSICSGTPVTFTASPTNQGTSPAYSWTINGQPAPGSTNSVTYPSSSLKNGDQVQVTLTSSSPCASPATASSNTVAAAVYPTPNPGVSGPSEICSGQSATLKALGDTTGSVYQWLKDGNPISGATSPTLKVQDNGNYSVKITNGGICTNQSPTHNVNVTNIMVNAGPDQEIKLTSGKVATVTMQGTSNGTSPTWQPASFFTNPQGVNAIANIPIGTQTLTLTDSIGSCVASDDVIITVKGPIFIPNAISPNGDGANDYWFIEGLEGYSEYTIIVFNRYGSVVHRAENYYTPWDGTRGGEPMPVATYYYVVKIPGEGDYNGTLTIMR